MTLGTDFNDSLKRVINDLNRKSQTLGVDNFQAYLVSQGYTGAFNENFYKALGDLGYTGTLNDRWAQWAAAEGVVVPEGLLFDPDSATGDGITVSGDNNETITGTNGAGTNSNIFTFDSYKIPVSGTDRRMFEVEPNLISGGLNNIPGIVDDSFDRTTTDYPGQATVTTTISSIGSLNSGFIRWRNTTTNASIAGPSWTSSPDYVQFVYDQTTGNVEIYVNGTGGVTVTNLAGDWLDNVAPAAHLDSTGDSLTFNVEGPFRHPISGTLPWIPGQKQLFDTNLASTSNAPTVSGPNNETVTGAGAGLYGTVMMEDALLRSDDGGVYQFEVFADSTVNTETFPGLADNDYDVNAVVPGGNIAGGQNSISYAAGGSVFSNLNVAGYTNNTAPLSYATGLYIQFVVDWPSQVVRVYRQGVLQATVDFSAETLVGGWRPVCGAENNGNTLTFNVDGGFQFPIAGATPWRS